MLLSLLRQWRRGRARDGGMPGDVAAALALGREGRHAEAERTYRALLERAPDDLTLLHLLGANLSAQSRWNEAIAVLRRVTAADPDSAEAYYNLGLAQKAVGDDASALTSYAKAIELAPARAEACVAAGTLLREQGALDEAEARFREAIARDARLPYAHYNLALVLVALQRFEEGLGAYRAALRCEPRFLLAHSNLLFLLNGHCDSPRELLAEHRAWAARHASALGSPHDGGHRNSADGARRLRVAYVSPDFWNHPVGRFMEPVLASHDRHAFEIVCYSAHAAPDAVTSRLRAHADRWIECAGWTDDALAETIRADGVDILVDLAGHTSGNRLLAFARRPAPVQVTYLGYPTSTGLDAIGYRVTDGIVDGAPDHPGTVETPLRLPHSYFCYAAVDGEPAIERSTLARGGTVTFGSFNAAVKWSEPTIDLWARVLQATPGSSLVLKAKDLSRPRIRERVLERFASRGVSCDRLALEGWKASTLSHLAAYNAIDIALDTYPYNGATTTCEALWMGVPVVTLRGPTHAARMGSSILSAVGLHALIADSPEHYVDICVRLACEPDRLDEVRGGLRERMRGSPLMDARGFTAALESQYRSIWRAWCTTRGVGLRP